MMKPEMRRITLVCQHKAKLKWFLRWAVPSNSAKTRQTIGLREV